MFAQKYIMPCLFLLMAILLFGGCKKRVTPSHLSDWEKAIWDAQVSQSGAKMWRADQGGRSWLVADELAYDKWIAEVSPSILRKWDIPIDCADSVMALRFIFALQHGLAIKFGKYNSTDYWDNPMAMLRKATISYGTQEIDDFSYLVDMWEMVNYQGGSFVLEDGHSYTINGLNELNLLTTLSSGPPITVKDLGQGNFFEKHNDGQRFRRFFAYERRGKQLIANHKVSYQAHPAAQQSSKGDWYDCVMKDYVEEDGNRIDQKPFWKNIYNFVRVQNLKPVYNQTALEADGIVCPHNVHVDKKYIQPGHPVPPQVDFKAIAAQMFDDLCDYLQERVSVVDEGFAKCHQNQIPLCTKEPHGEYSTPSRDGKIIAKTSMLQQLVSELKLEKDYLSRRCQLTLHPELDVKEKELEKEVALFGIIARSFSSAMWIVRAFNVQTRPFFNNEPFDPTRSYQERWGCHPQDKEFSCLEQNGFKQVADNILEGYPFEVEPPSEVGKLVKGQEWVVNPSDDFYITHDAMQDSLVAEGKTTVCFLPDKSVIKIVGFSADGSFTLFQTIKVAPSRSRMSYMSVCDENMYGLNLTYAMKEQLKNKSLSRAN